MKLILIIEDEKMLSDMYKFKLEREGFDIILAMEVDEAIELSKNKKPDLVLLDILLPRESGINFLIKIKDIDTLKSIPVLVFSNFDDNETKKQAFNYGAKDYLIKANYDPNEIVSKIKELLSE